MTKKNNGWININDKVPDKGTEVLIYVIDFFTSPCEEIAWLCKDKLGINYFESENHYIDMKFITHWQPLPQPSKKN